MKTDTVNPAIATAYSAIVGSDVFRNDGPAIDLPEALLCLAVAIRDHETDESTWSLGEHTEAPLGDLIVAAYWTLSEWHAGQSSPEYAALSALSQIYKPGGTNGSEPESCEAIAAEMLSAWFEAKHDASPATVQPRTRETMRPRLDKSRQFAMVEKANPLAVHVYFMSRERGEQFLREVVPDYCRRGIYMDKTLTPESFEIVEK